MIRRPPRSTRTDTLFPTRRSSDLLANIRRCSVCDARDRLLSVRWSDAVSSRRHRRTCADRSEEHTSELQSLMRISYAVFCLKKKKKKHNHTHIYYTKSTIHHTINKQKSQPATAHKKYTTKS